MVAGELYEVTDEVLGQLDKVEGRFLKFGYNSTTILMPILESE